MPCKCLIIEDELPAQEVLQHYIDRLPALELVGCYSSAVEAIAELHRQPIDLLFTDIQMPELSGLQLVRSLARPPKIIFTTAFSEHAVEAFDLGVVDYLCKPFSFDRFLLAVNRALVSLGTLPPPPPPADQELISWREGFLFLKVNKRQVKVSFSDILYAEAFGNYVKVHTQSQRMLLITETFAGFTSLLPEAFFVRVHKSYIVALPVIQQLDGGRIFVNGLQIPVGVTYRRALENRLLSFGKMAP
ncbi:LytR/AlgR family response regulator transcription factor [Hymenobacter terrenus]|uniref:LytR/AlgR family response regulator transcription factor n=1 Tax=Hymenobacter terrenus TaxID=1629124 RepID=UPI0006194DE9|nr:LytTR family DNA-binding domain-containing protein [Hymenobacter terrenus]